MTKRLLTGCCLLIFAELMGGRCFAQQNEKDPKTANGGQVTYDQGITNPAATDNVSDVSIGQTDSDPPAENKLGLQLLKNLVLDQEAIWTSPFRLRLADASWLVPFGAVAAASLAADTGISRAVTYSSSLSSKSTTFSNYGLAALGGVTGGLYLWGRVTNDDHKREAGILSGEAAGDALLVTLTLQRAFGRERPEVGGDGGGFWHNGTSFPSDHSTAAWAMASVIAHEYPGPFTKVFAYGLASAVSVSRVTGGDHFPTDVLIGAGIGWLTGRYVYHTHHDPDLPGDAWTPSFGELRSITDVAPSSAASTFVPLDSWVYPAFDRLAAMGYVTSALDGLKPWTRGECARLTNELGDALLDASRVGLEPDEQTVQLYERLKQEFARELGVENGNENKSATIDSTYARVMSMSGPILTDGFDLGGQTISYDFGRPDRRGTNEIVGASGDATLGPFAIYARVEYQHSPSLPTLPGSVLQFISTNDQVPLSPAGILPPIDRVDLLEGYIGFSHDGWQISAGKQALSWGVGEGGSMILSDNAEPLEMIRLTRTIPAELPGIFDAWGKFRTEMFVGEVNGGAYSPHPILYGQNFGFNVTTFLTIDVARTGMLGRGAGAIGGDPFTTSNFIKNLFAINSGIAGHGTEGEDRGAVDFSFIVPGLRHDLTLYSELFSNVVPFWFADPPDSGYRAGMYIPRLPRLHQVDFRAESTSTEAPIFSIPAGGEIFYWDIKYHDGYTNDGQLLGNTVGRQGRIFQGWTTVHLSSLQSLQFSFLDHQVDAHFVPGGGLWQDYSMSHEIHSRLGFYAKTMLQFEHIQHFPILLEGSKDNVTASVEVGFTFSSAKR